MGLGIICYFKITAKIMILIIKKFNRNVKIFFTTLFYEIDPLLFSSLLQQNLKWPFIVSLILINFVYIYGVFILELFAKSFIKFSQLSISPFIFTHQSSPFLIWHQMDIAFFLDYLFVSCILLSKIFTKQIKTKYQLKTINGNCIQIGLTSNIVCY